MTTAENEYKTVTRTITTRVVLEDVTDETADEFFAHLDGSEIVMILDGTEYVADILGTVVHES